MKTGVYAIRNKLNGKRYVGSASLSFRGRWKDHRIELRKNVHSNKHLQSAWNKYGEDAFCFEILEQCPPDKCVEMEQKWMDEFASADPRYGYNMSPTAGSCRGMKHSEQTREKHRRKWEREEFRSRITAARNTPEARAKDSARLKEVWNDPQRRAKMLEKHVAIRRRSDSRAQTAERFRAMWESEEYRKRAKEIYGTEFKSKCAAASRKGWGDPVLRAKRMESLARAAARIRQDPQKAAQKAAKISAALKGRSKSPEHRRKLSEAQKKHLASKEAVG